MNRKKDLRELTVDQTKKIIQQEVKQEVKQKVKQVLNKAMVKKKSALSFENDQLKIDGQVIADFSRFTSNINLISDIVYKNGDNYESIIFYSKSYNNGNKPSGKYYLLIPDKEHDGYFDSLKIVTD